MQNADYNTFNNYCVVLPRLQVTIDRISGGAPKEIKLSDAGYDTDDEKAQQRLVDLSAAQELWEVEVSSPLGFTWPQDTVSKWKIAEIAETF